MEEKINKDALRFTMAMTVMNQHTPKTIDALCTVAQKMDVDINELSMIYFSDCLETQITVASKMGVVVDLDGFFGEMKKKIEHDIETWHPKIDPQKIMEMFAGE